MIVYNVTIKVEHQIADEWLNWLKEEHIPDMKSTGCFFEAVIFRLMDTDESDGITFAVQYHAIDHNAYKRYLKEFSTALRNKSKEKWQNRIVAFRSVLELVH
jgi:hypothetical protein